MKPQGFYKKGGKTRPLMGKRRVGMRSDSGMENAARREVLADDKYLVGKTIYQQIAESRIRNEPLNLFRAVNADQFLTLKDGLQFRVKGDRFKGKIVVKRNWKDLYDVEFWRWNKGKLDMKKVDELNDIYADNLVESIWPKIVHV